MILKEFINRLPHPIRQTFFRVYGSLPLRMRYGRVFWETYRFLQESQWWSQEKLKEYQMKQLHKLLRHAYKNVPYYTRIFDKVGLKPKDIQDFDDFKKIPYLNKDTFKTHFRDIVARNFNTKRLPTVHTSGTTGKPLQFYEDSFTSQKEFASICHQWARVGYKPGDLRVAMRGPINLAKPAVYNPAKKLLRLAPFIDTKEKTSYYLNKINSFGAEFIHGYPGTIVTFAHAIRKYGLKVPFKLKAVLLASEPIYEWQRELVYEVFNCRVFSHYGMAEKVVLAAECEYSTNYHAIPQYGITEIDPQTHEIIGTGFLNYANPFIRYRTTDIASPPFSEKCNKCGREYYPILKAMEGRLGDFIVTPKGALISPAAITFPFANMKTLRDVQLIQDSPTLITIRAVSWMEDDSELFRSEIANLCQDLQEVFGVDMNLKVEIVDKIERSKSGKHKWIKSGISREFFEKDLK